jgi:hypothetical protein
VAAQNAKKIRIFPAKAQRRQAGKKNSYEEFSDPILLTLRRGAFAG